MRDKSQKYPSTLVREVRQNHFFFPPACLPSSSHLMDKNLKSTASYSDLFEDFFRSDAGAAGQQESSINEDIFIDLLGITAEDKSILQDQYSAMQSTDPATEFYLQQQQQQQQSFYFQYPTMIPSSVSSVAKPGFVRNRTRKNLRQKSVASAVKASHLMSNVDANTFAQGFQQHAQQQQQQQPQQQIPFYQAAAQISSFQMQPPQQQTVPVLLAAKSPAPQMTFVRSSNPSSPASVSARSPNSNSSDYVKMRLQQKIRSRMVSKGQIPPNPTEEELRMCGVQIPLSPFSINHQPYHNNNNNRPQQQMVTISQLPTPKQSPQQIPRAFNNNAAAFIAAPAIISNQSQFPIQEDYMMYNMEMNGYSQKDPLSTIDPSFNNFKQQQMHLQQQASANLYPQPPYNPQQQQSQQENGAVNYDQFFSDFILY